MHRDAFIGRPRFEMIQAPDTVPLFAGSTAPGPSARPHSRPPSRPPSDRLSARLSDRHQSSGSGLAGGNSGGSGGQGRLPAGHPQLLGRRRRVLVPPGSRGRAIGAHGPSGRVSRIASQRRRLLQTGRVSAASPRPEMRYSESSADDPEPKTRRSRLNVGH